MDNMQVRQGSQLPLQVNQGDSAATSVTIIMRNQETQAVYSVTASYVDGVANLVLGSDQTSVVGVYDYQFNENVDGEDPIIYAMDCEGDCDFPTIEVCEALVVS